MKSFPRNLFVALFALAISVSCFAGLSCHQVYSGASLLSLENLKIPITRLVVPQRSGFTRAIRILPTLDPKSRLLLVVNHGHTYLHFDGFNIDTVGAPGKKVTSLLKKTDLIYGDLVFVFHDLDTQVIEKLQQLISDFSPKDSITCVQSVCSFAQQVDPKVLENKSFVKASSLIRYLLQRKVVGDDRLEIVALNELDVGAMLSQLSRMEAVLMDSLKGQTVNLTPEILEELGIDDSRNVKMNQSSGAR